VLRYTDRQWSEETPIFERIRQYGTRIIYSETRHWVFLISLCIFAILQVLLRGLIFENSFIFSAIIVIMAGAFYGWQIGLLTGFVMVAANSMFFFGAGLRDYASLLREGGAAGFIMLITGGFMVGRVRELWDARKAELALRRDAETELRQSRERYRDLLATVERQARTLALLEQVQSALARELDRVSILRLVVEITARVFAYKQVSIYSVETDHLRLVHEVGYLELPPRISLDKGVMARCARTRQPSLLEDARQDPDYLAASDDISAEVCVPLFEGEHLVAVFNIESDHQRALNEEDLHLMLQLAEYVKVALERARLFANMQDHARQMALLNEITSTAVRANSPADMLFQTLADRLAALIDSDSAYLTLWDEVRQVPLAAAAYGDMRDAFTKLIFPPGQMTATAVVLNTGRALVIDDYNNSPFVSPQVRAMFSIRSALVLPLIANQQKLGAILFGFRTPHQFTGAEITITEQAAGQVALVLTKMMLIQRIEQMAITDELTGLYNRHGLADIGRREFERAMRYGRPLSVLLFDVDHFKQVNDQSGHAAGDLVLREIARLCRETLRETDLVVRYGGEEILVLMPENRLESALETAERLRSAIANMRVTLGSDQIEITASFGVAEASDRHTSLETLIACADQALYAAKQAGRNQVSACS
jgi:diguanylate cyclase (GGDEF)-like protein